MLRLAHEVAANLDWPARLYLLAEAGVVDQDEQDTFKVRTDRTWGSRPVLGPPCGGAFNLAPRARLDDVA
jgi:hypothetical protein